MPSHGGPGEEAVVTRPCGIVGAGRLKKSRHDGLIGCTAYVGQQWCMSGIEHSQGSRGKLIHAKGTMGFVCNRWRCGPDADISSIPRPVFASQGLRVWECCRKEMR